jgi:hypothetical protein
MQLSEKTGLTINPKYAATARQWNATFAQTFKLFKFTDVGTFQDMQLFLSS